MFRHVRSQNADLDGITIMGETTLVPADVVKRFGPPTSGDGYKISGEYAFLNEKDEAFVLHDWHSTNLMYDTAPTPEEFWAGTEPVEFSISSMDLDVAAFVRWLRSEVGGPAAG